MLAKAKRNSENVGSQIEILEGELETEAVQKWAKSMAADEAKVRKDAPQVNTLDMFSDRNLPAQGLKTHPASESRSASGS